MPARMPPGVPPTTSITPGTAATPIMSSRQSKRRPVNQGSTIETRIGATPMQVAATEAFASLMAP